MSESVQCDSEDWGLGDWGASPLLQSPLSPLPVGPLGVGSLGCSLSLQLFKSAQLHCCTLWKMVIGQPTGDLACWPSSV